MRSQPGAQKRPEAFNGVDVDFALAILVFIAGILALAVIDSFKLILVSHPVVDALLMGIDKRTGFNSLGNEWLNRLSLYILQQSHFYQSVPLEHTQHGRLFIGLGAPASFAFQPKMLQRIR